jgi:CBS domain-containing protein
MKPSLEPPPTQSATLASFLGRLEPFGQLEPAHLQWAVERMESCRFRSGGTVMSPEEGEARFFYVLREGTVCVEGVVQDNGAGLILKSGDCFPLSALLGRRSVASAYRAVDDALCHRLRSEDFFQLFEASAALREFCVRRISEQLEQSRKILQSVRTEPRVEATPLANPLSSLLRRSPVTCPPATPLKQVLATMRDRDIGAMIVCQPNSRPVGIFTLRDLLEKVPLGESPLTEPVESVMQRELVSLPSTAPAYEAALEMARHGIRHILVVDDGTLSGIVSARDLFSLEQVSLRVVSGAIRSAISVERLSQCSRDIRELAHHMIEQGMAAEQITRYISTLNDLLTQRVIQLELAKVEIKGITFCWIAMGSEGRFEQTLSTDQDNGIIFGDSIELAPDEVREKLLPVARRINEALDQCGIPLCVGQIMASNPRWCLALAEWKEKFADWIDHGDPEALLNATIFFDFRPLYGKIELAERLRSWLTRYAMDSSRFLFQMTQNALNNQPPLGLVRDFVLSKSAEYPHTLDLKVNGITPFVDAARVYSLATGIAETNTPQRLRLAAKQLGIIEAEAEAWVEAFSFIQLLRLRHQDFENSRGQGMHNHVDPDQLNELERRILKEALRQARRLQTRLARDRGIVSSSFGA